MALCYYVLSGQLLAGEVGSMVMFAIPEGFGERAMDEFFLQVLCYSACHPSSGMVPVVCGCKTQETQMCLGACMRVVTCKCAHSLSKTCTCSLRVCRA